MCVASSSYTDAQDPVLVTPAESDDLAKLVLAMRRIFSDFVVDLTNHESVNERVDTAFAVAVKEEG